MKELDKTAQEGLLGRVDVVFARFLANALHETDPVVLQSAAYVSRAATEQHVCLPLQELAETLGLAAEELERHLRDSGNVGLAEGPPAPLMLDEGCLWLQRLHQQERRVADMLIQRATTEFSVDRQLLQEVAGEIDTYWPKRPADKWQKTAALLAPHRGVFAIAGGPGTGKTTVVARLLALILKSWQPPGKPGICLAAPTGKAAMRLNEELRKAFKGEDSRCPDDISKNLPTTAFTLHRLIGLQPDGQNPRHHKENPLVADLVVVDEASMIDLALFRRLLDALSDRARLILLGDPQQLPSVNTGSVFADFCRGAMPPKPLPLTEQIVDSLPEPPPDEHIRVVDRTAVPLAGCLTWLHKMHRSNAEVTALAKEINAGTDPSAWPAELGELLEPIADDSQALIGRFAASFRDFIDRCAAPLDDDRQTAEATIRQRLRDFDKFRVLTPLRTDPRWGSGGLNREIERTLGESCDEIGQAVREQHKFGYPGCPVMATRNDYALGLFNGDIGITLRSADGSLEVWFESDDGLLSLSVGQLGSRGGFETCFATTIHKSQGSEFEEVAVVLPPRMTEKQETLLNRQMLYTAVTRAKEKVTLYGDRETLEKAIENDVRRHSRLAARLWPDDPPDEPSPA